MVEPNVRGPLSSPTSLASPRRGGGGGGGGGSPRGRGGFSRSSSVTIGGVLMLSTLVLLSLQMRTLLMSGGTTKATRGLVAPSSFSSVNSVSNLRTLHHQPYVQQQQEQQPRQQQCRFYLAESAIPHSGLGVFTAMGLHRGDPYIPDICIYVSDMSRPTIEWMHMRTHTWGKYNFFGQTEGKTNRAACHGMVTNFNTMPIHMVNSKIVSGHLPTHAGLVRSASPGAGASTHHFGIHGVALDTVTAGSELTIDYGDWTFDDSKVYTKPERPVDWIRENGWCIDNIDVMPATDPAMGRGAFARYPLGAGQVVAPAPLQIFRDRSVFETADGNEQLYVNYCLQPKNSRLVFFPYGQGVGVINHSRERANVKWRWSQHPMHHAEWLDPTVSADRLLEVSTPGGLILEVVALRDIDAGEELYVDYGRDWEEAWDAHVAGWTPPVDADRYVYPADVDETLPLRTVHEQVDDPYPENLITMCATPDWSSRTSGRTIQWYEPQWDWWRSMTFCHILERKTGRNGDPVYTVSLLFQSSHFEFDVSKPYDERYVDTDVPRRAIRFVEKPYMDDEHLPGAFRHPMEFPADLVPEAWLDDVGDQGRRDSRAEDSSEA